MNNPWVFNFQSYQRPIKSDHYPIIMQLDTSTEKSNPTPRLNFRDVNWDKLRATLKETLDNLPQPSVIKDIPTFKSKLDELNKAMWDAIDKHAAISKACPTPKDGGHTSSQRKKEPTQD